jgi:hypothetical protein
MPNPTMGEVADIDIPSNTSGQVVAPTGVGGVEIVEGTATPVKTYNNQGQGTWGSQHPTGSVPVKGGSGVSIIAEPSDVVVPVPNAPTPVQTPIKLPLFGGGGGGGGSADSTDTSGAVVKKPNYLLYGIIALGAYFVLFRKKK